MGFLDTLLGKTGKKVAGETLKYNNDQATQGYDANKNYLASGYTSATGRYQPYVGAGQGAQTAYTNLLGLNGQDAQRGAVANYETYNPYLTATMDQQTKALDRRAAATGQYGSGLNALAQARVVNETAGQNYQNYLAHLQGLGQQGLSASSAQAGLDMTNASGNVGIENAYRNTMMGNRNSYAKDYVAADTAGVQNIIGLGTAAAQLAMGMPPTALGNVGGQPAYSQAGSAANGGWSTTATKAPQSNNFFSQIMGMFG